MPSLVEKLAVLRTIPKFSVIDPSAKDNFFIVFGNLADQHNSSPEKRLSMFCSSLTDKTLDLYYVLSHSEGTDPLTYKSLKQTFIDIFRGAINPYKTKKVLTNRKQSFNKPTYSYVLSKTKLVKTYVSKPTNDAIV